MLLEALEALGAFRGFRGFRDFGAEDTQRFLGGIRTIFAEDLIIK